MELAGVDPAFGVPAFEFVNQVVEPIREGTAITGFTYNISASLGGTNTRTVTDPRGNPTVYTLNPYGATVEVVAPMGKRSTMKWATPDTPRPQSVPGHPSLPGVDVVIVEQTDALGQKTEYFYDDLGNVIKETVSFSGMAGDNLRPWVTQEDGTTRVFEVTTLYTYDPLFSKMTSKTDAEGNTTFYIYDSPPLSQSTGDPVSLPSGVSPPAYTGRPTGNLLAVIDALGNMTEYAYESATGRLGDLLTQKDPRGHVTRYLRYDAYGNPELIQDPEGNETTQQFDVRSRLENQTDTSHGHVEYRYDGLDRKIRETHFDDSVFHLTAQQTEYEYYAGGQLRWMRDGLGQLTRFEYDASNRLIKTTEEKVKQARPGTRPTLYTEHNLVTQYFYDRAGNLVRQLDPRGVEQQFFYDDLNRRTDTRITNGPTGPVGILTLQQGYDAVSNVISSTDLHGNKTFYFYDGLYRPVEARLPLPGTVLVSTAYDRVGNKVMETDPKGHVTKYKYDDIYRLEKKTDALLNTADFVYDRNSNVVKEIYTAGGVLTSQVTYDGGQGIDGLGRPTRKEQTVFLGIPSSATQVTYVTKYAYDDRNSRVLITSPRGNDSNDSVSGQVEELRDGLGRLHKRIVDKGGLDLTTEYTYDGNGNLVTVKDPQGGVEDVTFTYDGLNRKIHANYLLGLEESFTYDKAGNLIAQTDKRGTEFKIDYDNLNRVLTSQVRETISNGGQWLTLISYAYNDASNTVTQTDANGNATVKKYDALGRLQITTDPFNETFVSTYDGINKLSDTDKKGHFTQYHYDDLNRLVRTEEFEHEGGALRSTVKVEYRDAQNQVVETDRRGIETIRQNDSLGRLVQLSRNGIVLQQVEYDGDGNKVLVRDANGNTVKNVYDGAGRIIEMIEGAGSPVAASTHYTSYDKAGNLLSVQDARSSGAASDMVYTYDALYRKTSATNAAGETITYAYDGNNNLLSMTDPKGLGYQTFYVYDELNKLLAVDETARGGGVTRFAYDANRNKIAQQDANGNLVTYKYDQLNRLIDTFQHLAPGRLTGGTQRGADPRGANLYISAGGNDSTALHWHYGYDANGNRDLVIDARGQKVDSTYDYRNRQETQTFSSFADPGLDFQPLFFGYTYDGNGNLTKVREVKRVAGAGVTEVCLYAYDALDRLLSTTNYDNKTIAYTYDNQGNRTSVTDPDGRTTNYAYDQRNRLTTVVTAAGQTQYQYWPDNLTKAIVYPNGTVAEYQYDAADRLTSVVNHLGTVGVAPAQIISSYQYTYDANGNRLQQIETQHDLSGGAPEATTYQYDRLNRLIQVSYGSGAALSYTYAANGNRLTERGTDAADPAKIVDRTFAYDRVNRLSSITDNVDPAQSVAYDYDANGNRTVRTVGAVSTTFDANGNPVVTFPGPAAVTAYSFNIRDELVRAPDLSGEFVTFDYDYNGMRVKKLNPAGETRYLYDDRATLLEYNAAGATTVKYDYGHDVLTRTETGGAGTQFYLLDGLGSVVNLTGPAGMIQISYAYDAWGNVRQTAGASANPKQYTGHYFDAETGLHYFGARYYDGDAGLFISQDPYLGQADTPPSLHRYQYAYDNPLRFVDLTGYSSTEANASGDAGPGAGGLSGDAGSAAQSGGGTDDDGDAPADVTGEPNPYFLSTRYQEMEQDNRKFVSLEPMSHYYRVHQAAQAEARERAAREAKEAERQELRQGGWGDQFLGWAKDREETIMNRENLSFGGMLEASTVRFVGEILQPYLNFGAGVGNLVGKLQTPGARTTAGDWLGAGFDVLTAIPMFGALRGFARAAKVARAERAAVRAGGAVGTSQTSNAGRAGRNQLDNLVCPRSSCYSTAVADLVDPARKLINEVRQSRIIQAAKTDSVGAFGKDVEAAFVSEGFTSVRLAEKATAQQVRATLKAGHEAVVGYHGAQITPARSWMMNADKSLINMTSLDKYGHAIRALGITKGLRGIENLVYVDPMGGVLKTMRFDKFARRFNREAIVTYPKGKVPGGLLMAVLPSPSPASAGTETPTPIITFDDLLAAHLAATGIWDSLVPGRLALPIPVYFEDLPGSQVGEARILGMDGAAAIVIDLDAAGVGWFLDPTPLDHAEFSGALGPFAFQASADSPAAGKYDLLTVLLHETGHLLGFLAENPDFDSHVVRTIDGSQLFVGPDFTAVLTDDGEHLDDRAHPADLMNSTLAPSVRKLPSTLDVQIISAVRGLTGAAANSSPTWTSPFAGQLWWGQATSVAAASVVSSAKLHASGAPHTGILNGALDITDPNDPNFGWKVRGAASIAGGKAVLSEHDRVFTGLSQTFIVPQGMTTLRFTITGATFAANGVNSPPDAFEAALLDAQTMLPLVGTAAGLTQTDSFLNIQHGGQVFFGQGITVSGVDASGRSPR